MIVGFNYRWSPYMTKIKQLISEGAIGEVTSVDFNWYLNTHHGASYFRRWHGLMNKGGSLWIHKATHHFDLLNWWLSAEPEEVIAYGALSIMVKMVHSAERTVARVSIKKTALIIGTLQGINKQ